MEKLRNFIDREETAFWLFLLPALIPLFIFVIIPTISSFFLSFYEWDLLSDIKFVGIKNYIDLIHEQDFYKVSLNTFVFAIATTIFGVIIPLVLASIINKKIAGSEFFKTVYFLPFITPMIVIALIWEWIFDPNTGLMNYLLRTHIAWLYDENIALFAIIIVSVWKLIGYNMIIFLTGFSSINQNLYEASKIDGANEIQTFFRITIPVLSPVIFFVIIITTISSFQVFDLIFLMTQGGPMNSTNVLVYWIYQNAFEFFNIGKASAIAYVLFVIVFVLTIFQWKIRKKWVLSE